VEREFKAGGASGANEAWRVIPSPDRAPWAFQQPERLFRWRDATDLDAVVIQIRQNMDAADQRIGDFLEQAESNRQRLGRHNVVLDMRLNDGGNLLLTREFMAKWPSRLAAPGRFLVLTSPKTMSAGMASIAYLKQAGKDRVVLVGKAPGERLMYFAEGRPIRLPHSGLFLRPATARNDYETGCRNYDDCFVALAQPGRPTAPPPVSAAAVDRMPVAVSSLEPDLPAPWTVESWLTGTDPAMDAVSHALKEKR
jgi:hypothetical protein